MPSSNHTAPISDLMRAVSRLETLRALADDALSAFQVDLGVSPAKAFEWGMPALRGAAVVLVEGLIDQNVSDWRKRGLDDPTIARRLRNMALQIVTRSARFPARSSSPLSNLMATELAAIWGDVLDMLSDGGQS